MLKIGIVGEDPNDTDSIKNLITKKYKGQFELIALAKRARGSQLDTDKIKKVIGVEFQDKKCDFVLYIRDGDCLRSEDKKITQIEKWFKGIDSKINNSGILLLNTWEIEALILADIAAFNKIYKTKIRFSGDCSMQKDPKRELKNYTKNSFRRYSESDCPEIFSKLNFDTVQKNCKYFKDFINKFEGKLK